MDRKRTSKENVSPWKINLHVGNVEGRLVFFSSAPKHCDYLRAQTNVSSLLTEYSILLLGLDNAGKTTLLNTLKALYPTNAAAASAHQASSATAPPLLNPKPTVPTVGQNVSTLHLPDMYLKIWDVGGQDGLRSLWTSYFDVCHAIVFVVDSCDVGDDERDGIIIGEDGGIIGRRKRAALGHSDDDTDGEDDDSIHENMADGSADHAKSTEPSSRLAQARMALTSVLSHPSTASIPLLVLANKQDREDCVETVRIKEGLVRPVFDGELQNGVGGGVVSVRDSRVLPVSALKGDGVTEAVEWLRSRVRWMRDRGGRGPIMR